MIDTDALIATKLKEIEGVPFGKASGRRLQLEGLSPSELEHIIQMGLHDIANRVSPALLEMLPVVALEQLIVMSVAKDHDTAGLLKSVMNSFLVAYITPETHTRAYDSLQALEALRSEVATARQAPGEQLGHCKEANHVG